MFSILCFFPLPRFCLHLSLHSKFQRVLNGEIRKKRSTLLFLIRFICKLADSWIKSAFGEAYVASSCVISSEWVYSGEPYFCSFYPRKVFRNQIFMSTFDGRKAKRDRFLIQPLIIIKIYVQRSVSIVYVSSVSLFTECSDATQKKASVRNPHDSLERTFCMDRIHGFSK
jgi:hypothetical protein